MSNSKLYVGNLSYNVGDEQLNDLFVQHGEVVSAKVIMDRTSGRSRGFGFVEMSTPEEAEKAMKELDNSDFDGRNLRIREAKERTSRPEGRNFNKRY